MSKISVIGGLSYIWSNTFFELIKNNCEVILFYNFLNLLIEVLKGIENISEKKLTFYKLELNEGLIKTISYFENIILSCLKKST